MSEQRVNPKKTLALSGLILLVAAGIGWLIFSTEPTATRGGATKQTAMLVDVVAVERGTWRPTFVVTGTVEAARDIVLSPRVSGRIVHRAPNFVPGGFVEKGQTLLRIDPADYRNALTQRRSELRQARSDLRLEMGQQKFAQQESALLGELSEAERELVLREPQLEAVRSRIDAAQAAVNQAALNLQRTALEAPFDAQVLSREVNVGSLVAPGDDLGRLVGTEEFWVVAALPLDKRRWVTFSRGASGAEGEPAGSVVKIRNRAAWPEGVYRSGRLYQLIGALDEQTRLLRVIISVPDPMAREQRDDADAGAVSHALIVGAFVEARIQGKRLHDVFRLSRDSLRKDETVWVMQDGQLRIVEVDVVLVDAEYAYIESGLAAGDEVVTTSLATVSEGARLRVQQNETGR